MKQEKPEAAAEADQTVAMENFEQLTQNLGALNIDSLVCDVRDVILDILKNRPKPWGQMLEDEQRDIANGAENAAEAMVQAVVQLVAARGQDIVIARLDKFTGKGGTYQIALKAVGDHTMAADLAKLDGKAVLVVSGDAAPFYGVREADIQKNAPELFNEEEPGAPEGEPVDLEKAAEPEEA